MENKEDKKGSVGLIFWALLNLAATVAMYIFRASTPVMALVCGLLFALISVFAFKAQREDYETKWPFFAAFVMVPLIMGIWTEYNAAL